jgi:hypothetical protein
MNTRNVRLILAALALGAAACSPAAPAATTPAVASPTVVTATVPLVTVGPATAIPQVTSAATSAATPLATPPPAISAQPATPAVATAQVNLTFSGTKDFTAIGSAGACRLGQAPDGSVHSFGFEATESDYPGLGMSYSMAELSPGYVDIKWVLDGSSAYGRPGPAQGGSDADVVLSQDKHSVTIDVELSQFKTAGSKGPGPEHIAGTIICP